MLFVFVVQELLNLIETNNLLHRVFRRGQHKHPLLPMLRPTRSPKCRLCARTIMTDASAVRAQLRALLRDTAQPVAVVTALMDPSIPHASRASHTHNGPSEALSHGATLSSFSSIAMDPHPLVAFSLRIPSRMATSLASAHTASTSISSISSADATTKAHMVVNILSERQMDTAVRFSRPDVHPAPFAGLRYSLTEDGLPMLHGSVGALSCRLVAAAWPLHDLALLQGGRDGNGNEDGGTWEGEGIASELFIAQVVRVERTLPEGAGGGEAGAPPRPLLYYRRGDRVQFVANPPLEQSH
ncbi:flavin reductase like domain-containing protein [Daedaleopsis nitida]|nr:flavin reductase like domain-containing protein [Daedaleopsis nitida]